VLSNSAEILKTIQKNYARIAVLVIVIEKTSNITGRSDIENRRDYSCENVVFTL
jgi:hypothetical protein